MEKNKPVREGFLTVTPYLIVRDAKGLVAFLVEALGGVITYCKPRDNGDFAHVELRLGESMLMIAEAQDEVRKTTMDFHLYVDKPDDYYKQAMSFGAISAMAPTDTMYKERVSGVKDAWGNVWWFAKPIS